MRPVLPGHRASGLLRGPLPLLLCAGAVPGSPVRLSRRRPLLLSAPRARAEGMERRPLAPLGAEENAGMPLHRQSDGGRALSGQADLRRASLRVGGADLHRRSLGAGLRRDARPHALLGHELGRLGAERTELHLRCADSLSVLQHHLPGRCRLASAGNSRRRPLGQAGPAAGRSSSWRSCWRCRCSGATRSLPFCWGSRGSATRSALAMAPHERTARPRADGIGDRPERSSTVLPSMVADRQSRLFAAWFVGTVVLAHCAAEVPAIPVAPPTPAPALDALGDRRGRDGLAGGRPACVRPPMAAAGVWRSPLGAMWLGLAAAALLAMAAHRGPALSGHRVHSTDRRGRRRGHA